MKLLRLNHDQGFTAGILSSTHFEDTLYTLEQEWRADPDHLGGENNNSCVPDGLYLLTPFIRPKNGLMVPQLSNPDLGVYGLEIDLPPEGGRFLILMHPGNTAEDIVGCIACGMYKAHPSSVNQSRDAQAYLIQAFNEGDRQLEILSFRTTETYAKKAD